MPEPSRRRCPPVALLVICLGSAPGARAASAADSWPSFRGDARLQGRAETPLPATLELLFTYETEGAVESTAAIESGVAYLGSADGSLHAIDLETGKARWKYRADAAIKSSPGIREDIIYFGDSSGAFHAISARDGSPRWRYETGAEVASSASFAGASVLFGSYDNHLYALDASDGKLRFRIATEAYVHATPAIEAGRALFAGCDGLLRVIDVAAGRELSRLDLKGYVGASAALAGGRAYLGTFTRGFVAIDVQAPEPRVAWTYTNPDREEPFYASAASSETALIVAGRDKLVRALDPATGKELWRFPAGAKLDSSPVIAGERVYVGSEKGELLVLRLRDGELVQRFETEAALRASPAVAEGKLVIGNKAGIVYVLGRGQARPEPAR